VDSLVLLWLILFIDVVLGFGCLDILFDRFVLLGTKPFTPRNPFTKNMIVWQKGN
jgi:hypothetical protein